MKAFRVAAVPGLLCFGSALTASATTYYVAAGATNGTGTSASPFNKVQNAANVAVAGDTVIIENGTYPENVVVKNSGSSGKSIVFRAQNNRGALLYSISPASSGTYNWTALYVTVQGINFNPPNPGASLLYTTWVNATTGWDFEDCTFQGYTQLEMIETVAPVRSNITVHHCLFTDCYAGSFGGYGVATNLLTNVLVQDCIVRRSNLSNITDTGWNGGVNKFLFTNNVTINGLIAYDNNGAPIWLDTDNQSFAVRNCTVFGNHSGYSWGTATNPPAAVFNPISIVDIEADQGPGMVQNNVIYSNQDSRGVCDNSSGGGYGVTGAHRIDIEDNIFADNNTHIFYEAQTDSPGNPTNDAAYPYRTLGNTLTSGNTFYAWNTQMANAVAVNGNDATSWPSGYGVGQSGNTYSSSIPQNNIPQWQWGWWSYDSGIAWNFAQLQTGLHLEDGTSTVASIGSFANALPANTIYPYPTQAQVQAAGASTTPLPSKSELSQLTPTTSIDTQISSLPSNQTISTSATITVYGHSSPYVLDHNGNSLCEVYDHEGRWVSLTVQASNLAAFNKVVTPYATLNGTNITVTVTYKSPYSVTATY